jgi:concanavalin A-like lectin/glucanase superfamily protein/Big-like domain-containing protein/purple acid phosphatase-like protein
MWQGIRSSCTRFAHLALLLVMTIVAPLPAFSQTTPGAPNPTLLPAATTAQFPLTAAYNALGVPSLAAGGSYLDPTTQVKIYKLTSAAYPTSSPNWGHDYSEGGDEVSLPYNGNARAVLVRQNSTSGGPYWLIDFTPGVGVGNPRQLPSALSPWIDVSFTFSNNQATPYYAYVATASAVRRFDIRTMAEAPGDGWPVNETNATWLHQSEDDGFFVWMRGATGSTIVGYEPNTGTLRTYTNANLNEPRVDRAGRYVGISMNSPMGGLVVWDWQTSTVVWTTDGTVPFAHNASLRRRWLNIDWGQSWPSEFTMFTPDVPNSTTHIGGPAIGTLTHGNGNWIQHPADLNDQWAVFTHYGSLYPTGSAWLAPGGMVLITPNGQRRLLGHPYNTTGTYNYFSFAKFSSDGRYILFTSDMNGSGRSDVFLAELPQGGSSDTTPPTVMITTPILGAILSGTTTVAANASDNVGVAGVQFKLDGVNLGAEDTIAPYAISWNTTLATNALHTLTAVARDAAGNTATATAATVTVSNTMLDITPPVISAVASATVSSTGTTITWTTNEASDSQVDYGPTTSYGSSTALNTAPGTAHSQTLSGLAAGTLYHYRVKSRDAAGNLATSGDFTFTTATGSTTPGFVGYWKFDESIGTTTADASGNGDTGTLANKPNWVTGKLGYALSFNGSNQYVNVPNKSILNAYPMTVAVWMKTTNTTGLKGIVNKYAAGSQNGYQVFMNGGNLCAWYFRNAANRIWDGSGCTLMTPGYNDNQWHQVVLVVDAGGGRLYVDGVLKASQGWTGTPGAASTTQNLSVGRYPGTASPYWPGIADDVRIYNYALDATEVSGLFAGADSTPPTISAVASSTVSSTGATIGWTTNEAGDSQVEYGSTTSYGSSTALNTALVTAHSQTLSELAAGTLYHYRVKSRDAAGNLATSGDNTFAATGGTVTPGFVGYWKFDEGSGVTAVDSSGNDNAGTLFNGTAWTTGKLNGALSFDGMSGYVNVPHTATLDSYPLTVAAWIKTSATGMNGIVNKYYPGSMNGYQVFMNGGNLCAWYFRDATNYVWDGSGCTLMTPGYNDNQWHQVVLVVDAGGGRLYVDGMLKASQGWTGTPGATSTTQPLNIASYPGTASPYLPGMLDDVRIYNYALAVPEITNLFNAAAAPAVENVTWTNLVNVTATGNSVQKTAGCDGCEDAGATSQQQIASGDGYLEFTASEITALRYAGLSNGNPGTSAAEITYAVRLQSGIAEVNENGVYQAGTSFAAGDVFRIAVKSGAVTYYKNGTPFYTSTAAPSYPLLVDTAILDLNGTVTNAVISRVP